MGNYERGEKSRPSVCVCLCPGKREVIRLLPVCPYPGTIAKVTRLSHLRSTDFNIQDLVRGALEASEAGEYSLVTAPVEE